MRFQSPADGAAAFFEAEELRRGLGVVISPAAME